MCSEFPPMAVTWYKTNLLKSPIDFNYLLVILSRGDDSSLPVCSVSCTVHLQLFTNIDILWVRPESTYTK